MRSQLYITTLLVTCILAQSQFLSRKRRGVPGGKNIHCHENHPARPRPPSVWAPSSNNHYQTSQRPPSVWGPSSEGTKNAPKIKRGKYRLEISPKGNVDGKATPVIIIDTKDGYIPKRSGEEITRMFPWITKPKSFDGEKSVPKDGRKRLFNLSGIGLALNLSSMYEWVPKLGLETTYPGIYKVRVTQHWMKVPIYDTAVVVHQESTGLLLADTIEGHFLTGIEEDVYSATPKLSREDALRIARGYNKNTYDKIENPNIELFITMQNGRATLCYIVDYLVPETMPEENTYTPTQEYEYKTSSFNQGQGQSQEPAPKQPSQTQNEGSGFLGSYLASMITNINDHVQNVIGVKRNQALNIAGGASNDVENLVEGSANQMRNMGNQNSVGVSGPKFGDPSTPAMTAPQNWATSHGLRKRRNANYPREENPAAPQTWANHKIDEPPTQPSSQFSDEPIVLSEMPGTATRPSLSSEITTSSADFSKSTASTTSSAGSKNHETPETLDLESVKEIYRNSIERPTVTRPFTVIDANTGEVYSSWEGIAAAHTLVSLRMGNPQAGIVSRNSLVDRNGNTCTYDRPFGTQRLWLNDRADGNKQSGRTFSCSDGSSATYDVTNEAASPRNAAYEWSAQAATFFKSVSGKDLNRNIQIEVHHEMMHALWTGSALQFGDGIRGVIFPMTEPDIVTHEVAHIFTDSHSKLENSGQAGAISEAFSDMAAVAFMNRFLRKTEFSIGKTIIRTNQALRDLCNPGDTSTLSYTARDPPLDSASQWKQTDGIHKSSGVYSKAFCTLARTPGWDIPQAFKVFVDANMFYWSQKTTFNRGACGVRSAAFDLKGTNAIRDVDAAFRAVGVICSQ